MSIFGRDKKDQPDEAPAAAVPPQSDEPIRVSRTFRRPSPIKEGSAVAVVSPSFGASGRWPHRAERGTRYVESLGLWVKTMPNADRQDGWVSAPAAERADDIHRAFEDEDVSVVVASIGGNHCNQLLPYLD
ncbi:MAG: LD-carboxypeptidase, partial [Actinomycetota bacterium]